MNNEIKEILDSIKEQSEEENWIQLSPEFIQPLLDYITYLQQELEEEKRINQEDLKYIDELNERIEKAVDYIEKNLLPSHSIEKTDWEFEEVIYSDLPVEAIKPLIDILNGRSDE